MRRLVYRVFVDSMCDMCGTRVDTEPGRVGFKDEEAAINFAKMESDRLNKKLVIREFDISKSKRGREINYGFSLRVKPSSEV